jgi:hypothetical protein
VFFNNRTYWKCGFWDLEKIYLLNCPQIGVRETRHIQGEYVLTIEDVFLLRMKHLVVREVPYNV